MVSSSGRASLVTSLCAEESCSRRYSVRRISTVSWHLVHSANPSSPPVDSERRQSKNYNMSLYPLQRNSLVARRATYVVDRRFFGHFFWKVEGSSAHTHESCVTHMCHMQLTCGKLLYGGGEPPGVAHMCHMWNVWQLTCTLLLYVGGEPSHVSHVERVAINLHVTTIWWRGALTCGSRVSRVAINVYVTTIWWREALTCVTCGTCGN